MNNSLITIILLTIILYPYHYQFNSVISQTVDKSLIQLLTAQRGPYKVLPSIVIPFSDLTRSAQPRLGLSFASDSLELLLKFSRKIKTTIYRPSSNISHPLIVIPYEPGLELLQLSESLSTAGYIVLAVELSAASDELDYSKDIIVGMNELLAETDSSNTADTRLINSINTTVPVTIIGLGLGCDSIIMMQLLIPKSINSTTANTAASSSNNRFNISSIIQLNPLFTIGGLICISPQLSIQGVLSAATQLNNSIHSVLIISSETDCHTPASNSALVLYSYLNLFSNSISNTAVQQPLCKSYIELTAINTCYLNDQFINRVHSSSAKVNQCINEELKCGSSLKSNILVTAAQSRYQLIAAIRPFIQYITNNQHWTNFSSYLNNAATTPTAIYRSSLYTPPVSLAPEFPAKLYPVQPPLKYNQNCFIGGQLYTGIRRN